MNILNRARADQHHQATMERIKSVTRSPTTVLLRIIQSYYPIYTVFNQTSDPEPHRSTTRQFYASPAHTQVQIPDTSTRIQNESSSVIDYDIHTTTQHIQQHDPFTLNSYGVSTPATSESSSINDKSSNRTLSTPRVLPVLQGPPRSYMVLYGPILSYFVQIRPRTL